MYCKNCGTLQAENKGFCESCGFHPLTEKNYCQHCGAKTLPGQVICIECKNELFPKELTIEKERKAEEAFRAVFDREIQYLSRYYQREFTKIYESEDSYKGKWNWSAFFFGSIWLLFKGCWASAIISLVIIFVTFGLAAPIFWIVIGARGNWIYYHRFVRGRQILL